jgi:hypothetical protein
MTRPALALLPLVALVAACADTLRSPIEPTLAPSAPALGKTPTYTPVSLRVTMAATQSDGVTPYRIRGDGAGDYVDGAQNVSATIDQYGNFIFDNRAVIGRGVQRRLTFDLSDPVQVAGPPITPDPASPVHLATFPVQGSPLQNLATDASVCVKLGGGFTATDGTSWHVSFRRGQEDTPTSPTAFVVVTRVNATTWTMKPSQSCDALSADVGAVRDASSLALQGHYHLPFAFTLSKK